MVVSSGRGLAGGVRWVLQDAYAAVSEHLCLVDGAVAATKTGVG